MGVGVGVGMGGNTDFAVRAENTRALPRHLEPLSPKYWDGLPAPWCPGLLAGVLVRARLS